MIDKIWKNQTAGLQKNSNGLVHRSVLVRPTDLLVKDLKDSELCLWNHLDVGLATEKNTLKHGHVSRNPPALNVTQSAGAAAWVAQFVETVETCKTDWWKSNDWCDWKPPAASMGLACTLWRAYIHRIASHYSLVESANLDSCTCCGCPLSMPGALMITDGTMSKSNNQALSME